MPVQDPVANSVDAIDASKRLRFVIAAGLVAGGWLIVLPWWASQPVERASWQSLEQSRIDPSAMYYTELEAMEPILQKLNAGNPILNGTQHGR